MGWTSYILYVYINSRVAKMVLSSSCINIKCVVTDFIRHYLKLAFCEEKYSRKIWLNLINTRENGKIIDEHKGFISGKWLGEKYSWGKASFFLNPLRMNIAAGYKTCYVVGCSVQ